MRSTHLLTCNREEVRLHRPWPAWAVPAIGKGSVPESSTDPDPWVQWVQLDASMLGESLLLSSLVPGVPLDKSVIILLSYVTLWWKPKCIFSRGSSHAHTMKLSNLGNYFLI